MHDISTGTEDFNRIKEWLMPKLEAMNLSVEEFADATGLTRASIYNYVCDRHRPNRSAIAKMTRVLGVPLEEGLRQYTSRPRGRPHVVSEPMVETAHAPVTETPSTLTSARVLKRMEELNLSIRDLALKVDVSYEHARVIVRGKKTPSKHILKTVCEALNLPLREMEQIRTADKIRETYGNIPLELSAKNPELEPIERIWNLLSKQHKSDLIAIARAYAQQDQAR
jgi:transcriptional regulator with XRE-family HTH domain